MHVTIDIQRQMLFLFMDEPAACVVFASSVSSCSLLQIVKKKNLMMILHYKNTGKIEIYIISGKCATQ